MKKYPPRGSELVMPGEVARPIFGLDIDGTLGYYHEHFHRFAEAWTGKTLPAPSTFAGGSFAKHLGMSKSTYRRIKLAYRRGGAKRSMPLIPYAHELTASLRRRGAVVVLCTTRPYLNVEPIDDDTHHWAKRNGIKYDFIIWGERKYIDLSRFGSRVVSILEDDPSMLRQANSVGLLSNRPIRTYNLPEDSGVRATGFSFGNLMDAEIGMLEQLDEWELRNR